MITLYSGNIVNMMEPKLNINVGSGTEPYIQIGWSTLGDLHRGDRSLLQLKVHISPPFAWPNLSHEDGRHQSTCCALKSLLGGHY